MWVPLFFGVILLYLGSESLIRGASSFAIRLKIKPLVIGLTVIAFGTSSPEFVVSMRSVITGHGQISLGDIIGSNIFNIGGILSLCAMIRPIPMEKSVLRFNIPVMYFSFLLFSIFLFEGTISRLAGGIFVTCLCLYTFVLFTIPKKRELLEMEAVEEIEKPLKCITLDLLFIFGGLVFLFYGAELLISAAIDLAKWLGVSEASIALGVVALGTSLPELCCSIIAVFRRKYDLLIGSIIGSNIFNIFSVIGIASLVHPIPVANIRMIDIGMMILSGVFILPIFQKKKVFGKCKAMILFCIYVFYILYLYKINGIF